MDILERVSQSLFGRFAKAQKAIDNETESEIKRRSTIFSTPEESDGAIVVENDRTANAFGYNHVYSTEFSAIASNVSKLIETYREMALYYEVDFAISEIVDAAIVVNDEEDPVSLMLDNTDFSDDIKKKILDAFDHILVLYDFRKQGSDIFRRWYVDGRSHYHKIIDEKKPKEGIVEIRRLDSRKMSYIREVERKPVEGVSVVTGYKDFFVYDPTVIHERQYYTHHFGKIIKIPSTAIIYSPSGFYNQNSNTVLSYLDKAIKPANQLRMVEDSAVIYRLSRAPERRVFYIDVGNLPKSKAEQYLKGLMTNFKTNIEYDPKSGSAGSLYNPQSIMEDFWLPRRNGAKGTEVTTLPGGQNLGEIDDIEYFARNLYRALNVPYSRVDTQNGGGFLAGRNSEITRDEFKFHRFIQRLQIQFANCLLDPLKDHAILTGIITEEDWGRNSENFSIQFKTESPFYLLKNLETMDYQLQSLQSMEQYVNKYFSHGWVLKKVFGFSDEEIVDMKKEIEEEANDKIFNPPNEEGEEDTGFGGKRF